MAKYQTMDASHALDQIAQIHDHLARGEAYRGFRALPVLLSGGCGLLAACLQNLVVPADEPRSWIIYWVLAAAVSGAVGGSATAFNYLFRDHAYTRRKTERVLGQLVPALFAGGALTLGLAHAADGSVRYLPGLWALVYGLGIFSARPYLPRAAGWVGLYFLFSGMVLLLTLRDGDLSLPPGWQVGGVFALGQIAAGLMLVWNVERKSDA